MQVTYLSLLVGFETKQTTHFVGLSMDDTRADHVIGIRINTIQKLHTETGQFVPGTRQIQRLLGLEHTLGPLLLTVKNKEIRSTSSRLMSEIPPKQLSSYPPRFLHRAKNDSAFISVGSKNLFTVKGRFTVSFCGAPPFTRNEMTIDGAPV